MVFEHIQTTKILGAIAHKELVEQKGTRTVSMQFELDETCLPANLLPPQNHLRTITNVIAGIVRNEMGHTGAIEWDIGMGAPQLTLTFRDKDAPLAHEAWGRIAGAIDNLRSQHLRN